MHSQINWIEHFPYLKTLHSIQQYDWDAFSCAPNSLVLSLFCYHTGYSCRPQNTFFQHYDTSNSSSSNGYSCSYILARALLFQNESTLSFSAVSYDLQSCAGFHILCKHSSLNKSSRPYNSHSISFGTLTFRNGSPSILGLAFVGLHHGLMALPSFSLTRLATA